MMKRIPMNTLRESWTSQGYWGAWRQRLSDGYLPGELYFEFGLMPSTKAQGCDYRMILDHEVHVLLCRRAVDAEYVIRPSDAEANHANGEVNRQGRTLIVTPAQYSGFLQDAAAIFAEYQDPERGSFWSIPDKWFADLSLVRFVRDHVVATEAFNARTRMRQDWYWP
jgi:hypothetical protein